MKQAPVSMDNMIIVGTDTGVGKSVVSLLIMQLLYARGFQPFYLKPFQTGCKDPYDVDSDARFVYQYTQALKDLDPAESVIYCHPNPKAPFFAATDTGDQIKLSNVQQVVNQKGRVYSPLVIEAAGGLMVPINEDLLVVDVVKALECRPLLVARAGLGTINHSLLSIEALRKRDLEPLGVVFVDQDQQVTPPDLVAENMAAIEMIAKVPVAGLITSIEDFSSPPSIAYQPLEKVFFGQDNQHHG